MGERKLKKEDMRNLMDISEASEFLGVSASTIRTWISLGEITTYRIGRQIRFRPNDLDKFVRRNQER